MGANVNGASSAPKLLDKALRNPEASPPGLLRDSGKGSVVAAGLGMGLQWEGPTAGEKVGKDKVGWLEKGPTVPARRFAGSRSC